jgi:hypothetical protein
VSLHLIQEQHIRGIVEGDAAIVGEEDFASDVVSFMELALEHGDERVIGGRRAAAFVLIQTQYWGTLALLVEIRGKADSWLLRKTSSRRCRADASSWCVHDHLVSSREMDR